MKLYKAQIDDAGKRVDIFISERLSGISRASLKPLFNGGYVYVNSRQVKSGSKLNAADRVEVDTGPLQDYPAAIELPIVYEDEDVIIINKPAGILTHSKGAVNLEPTVASFIKPKVHGLSLDGNRAGIVHRLDRATSGLIITAKNEKALKFLQRQFAKRRVNKLYLAVIDGELSPAQAIIDVPIERNPRRQQTFRVGRQGRPAQTQYTTLKTLSRNGANYSLLELRPLTGRTHQLRVHMAYLGHPIVGDPVYGKEGGPSMLLHAASLELVLPSGQMKKFKVEPPPEFLEFITG